MAQKKISRKELLRTPDEFLTFSQKVFQYVSDNTKKVVILASLAVALVILTLGTKWYLGYTAGQALAAYTHALAQLPADKDFDPQKAEAATQGLENLIASYPRTPQARDALLELGALYYRLNRFEKSREAYEKFLEGLRPEEESLKPLILDSLAQVFEAKGDPKQAAERWEQILTLPGELLKDQAYLGLGRVYLALGRKDKAKKAYQDLLSSHPQSASASLAEAKLASIREQL